MTCYIALLRGVNVGGAGAIKMKDLVETLCGVGLKHVETYIQSGNIIFDIDSGTEQGLQNRIETAISDAHGFKPRVMVFSRGAFAKIAKTNPFAENVSDPKMLHVFFCSARPNAAAIEHLTRLKSKTEQFALVGKALYLLAPDGVGRSKLAAGAEKALGVDATARNWRTIGKLLSMAEARA